MMIIRMTSILDLDILFRVVKNKWNLVSRRQAVGDVSNLSGAGTNLNTFCCINKGKVKLLFVAHSCSVARLARSETLAGQPVWFSVYSLKMRLHLAVRALQSIQAKKLSAQFQGQAHMSAELHWLF